MTTDATLPAAVEEAAERIAPAWPLHSFVTANPLSGFEDHPFPEAVRRGEALFGGRGYPGPDVFRRALHEGRIDRDRLADALDEHGFEGDPEALLDEAAEGDDGSGSSDPERERLDRLMSKWLGAFLDEGRTNWPMPDREEGFYQALRAIAPHDDQIPDHEELELPETPTEALARALEDVPRDDRTLVLEQHLAALPGWTGLVKRRQAAEDPWQDAAPIDLVDYAAARLALADHLGLRLAPPETAGPTDEADPPVEEAFLSAWEATYRDELVEAVQTAAREDRDDGGRPDAQLAFCIDTRSEVLRRHLEHTGDYETHGYAGFFGVPIRYTGHGDARAHPACPPIVDPQHEVPERPTGRHPELERRYEETMSLVDAARSMIVSLKRNPATAFPFVEHTGAGYGAALTARTLVPDLVRDLVGSLADRIPATEGFCEPSLEGMDLEEQVAYAARAVELMGIERFAPVVALVGHASETANNPFDASLDCGACAGNPGGPNARTLATICNRGPVRQALRDRGIQVPEDTVFVAGEHNTTTDEVTLVDGPARERHPELVDRLEADLAEAGRRTAAERLGLEDPDEASKQARRQAADWSQTRPEWGLAGNASFFVGRREVPGELDLDGRAFLHSYDWRTDDEGEALEAILTGPWVVTEWINLQYYFASVDNAAWGSGSKVTQTPVGNALAVQGNGGDAAVGLPKESLVDEDGRLQHQPLRLSTVVEAPADRVEGILAEHEHLDRLVANGWLSLTVVDPTEDHRAYEYRGQARWSRVRPEAAAEPPAPETEPAPPAARR
jgi:uncharacterized protein YbcC (UPF0753/DUF2309 family)